MVFYPAYERRCHNRQYHKQRLDIHPLQRAPQGSYTRASSGHDPCSHPVQALDPARSGRSHDAQARAGIAPSPQQITASHPRPACQRLGPGPSHAHTRARTLALPTHAHRAATDQCQSPPSSSPTAWTWSGASHAHARARTLALPAHAHTQPRPVLYTSRTQVRLCPDCELVGPWPDNGQTHTRMPRTRRVPCVHTHMHTRRGRHGLLPTALPLGISQSNRSLLGIALQVQTSLEGSCAS